MRIELLWFDGCPNYRAMRELLEQVLREEKIDAPVALVQVRDHTQAVEQKFLGSPTIRLDGIDPFAEPGQDHYAMQCRIYRTPEGLKGWPTREMLRGAMRAKYHRHS